jgi:catechol 2,3-dioxygenase-like lactoylglutathione lyase family enzyme
VQGKACFRKSDLGVELASDRSRIWTFAGDDDKTARMLANSSLVAFGATTDAKRARTFYEGVLGLQLISDDDFAIAYDVNGVSLRIQKVEQFRPQPFTVLGWSVSSIDAATSLLIAKGVVFERYSSLQQDPRGIWRSPSGAKVAWLKDPDGNVISLTERSPG